MAGRSTTPAPNETTRRPHAQARRRRRRARCRAAAVEEIFRRFEAREPEPKGELEHTNPYTLLVAVVLSAQATDAGVNKATRTLFAGRRHAGEDGGARRGQRARVHQAPSGSSAPRRRTSSRCRELLIERARRRGAADPRGAGALPGVGRKTANVVLNIAFGAADHGGRHACLPRRQPHRPRAGQDAGRGRAGLEQRHAGRVQAPRASLADPARPLRLQGAQAASARSASSPTSAVPAKTECPPARIQREIRCRSSRVPRTGPSRDSARRRRG